MSSRAELQPGSTFISSFYEKFYAGDRISHVPIPATESLYKRSGESFGKLTEVDRALDLGAGRQLFERQLFRGYRGQKPPKCRIDTLDIAQIPSYRLLENKSGNTRPIRADGGRLPYRDSTFSLVVSNMAFEFMSDSKYEELGRVTRSGGEVFINVLHDSAPPIQIEDYKRLMRDEPHKRAKHLKWLNYWNVYSDVCPQFTVNTRDISTRFEQVGFKIKSYKTDNAKDYYWVEIDLVKK